jgi:purine-binding chemotaxis protein CheW
VNNANPSQLEALASSKGETRHLRAVLYRMGETDFATEVSQVQEIVRPTRLARPAKILDNVEGLIKRRGRLVPIVDLRRRLGLSVSEPTVTTCAVIVKLPIGPVGFMVDAALALRWIKLSDMETPAIVLARIDQAYIQGLAVQDGQVIMMLDLMRVLSAHEQTELAGALSHV